MSSTSSKPLPLDASSAATYFQTSRLLFRACKDTPADSALIHRSEADTSDHLFASGGIQKPENVKRTDEFRKWLMNDTIIGIIICLLPDPSTPDDEPIPVGTASIDAIHGPIHRGGMIGISILKEHRGKGYGEETIRWLTSWGFKAYGLHRIERNYFSWDEGAGKLYRKIGSREEGRLRERYWFNGVWGDEFVMAVRAEEWDVVENKRRE